MAEARVGADVKVSFWLAVFLIAAAALIEVGAVAWLLSPVILLLLIYAMARAPLRHSLMVLMFCAFVLENPNDAPAAGYWQSPFFRVGWAMLAHLNNLTGVRALAFSGMDIALGVLCVVALLRQRSGSKLDRVGRTRSPRIMIRLAYLSLLGIGYAWLVGMLRGGDFNMALWQVEAVVHIPIVYLLCEVGFRGPRDHHAIGKVLLAAAVCRALQALYVSSVVVMPEGRTLAYATTHHDSMLFASAFVMLLLLMFEKAGAKYVLVALLLLPILALGMIANSRRMVWVQVAMVLLTLYLATPESRLKRKARRVLYALSPLGVGYLVTGWNSQAPIFGPVQTVRSVVEPETDASSMWREIENYNIIYTLKQHPVFGYGYGNPFWEMIHLPEVGYPLEHFLPHNALLGLWCFAGLIGYTLLTLQWCASVYLGMRGFYHSTKPTHRVAAIMAVGSVIIYMVQCYGDVGLGAWAGVFIVAPTMALAGKLAVASGAWSEATVGKSASETAKRKGTANTGSVIPDPRQA